MMITGKTQIAGVMGWPVSHSASPILHGYWLKKYNIDGVYIPLAVAPENAADAIAAIGKLGFKGVNLTIPHKVTALKVVDHLDPIAERIGAANTIVVRDDGSLVGRNTDAEGYIASLKESFPDWNPERTRVMVIGAGGAARAIVTGLLMAGCPHIFVMNRNLKNAAHLVKSLSEQELGEKMSIHTMDQIADYMPSCELLVNATSLGMIGQPSLDLDMSGLSKDAIISDIVYTPLETRLLTNAKAQGLRTVDGLGMLLHQAVGGFEAWFDHRPEVTPELRAHVIEKMNLRPST